MGFAIAFGLTGLLGGVMLGYIIAAATRPARDPDRNVRQLLADYAAAVTAAQVYTDMEDPNLLNKKTRARFRALGERYIKELTK